MENYKIVSFDSTITVLSSTRRAYKTEGFIRQTNKVALVDVFLSKIAESVFADGYFPSENVDVMAETEDKLFTVYFTAKKTDRTSSRDVIFYKFLSQHTEESGVDRRLYNYVIGAKSVNITLKTVFESKIESDFEKLYLISNSGVNFPLLSSLQRKIVQTENANMLVQGVAGSGKTNVCVEKIVYCACRLYRGKVLYTTFSRGLLTETKNRVSHFLHDIDNFVDSFEKGKVVFLDENHKKAVENKLGIYFDTDDDGQIVQKLKLIAHYLENKVDYKLIEDIYADYFEKTRVFNENLFITEYAGDKKGRVFGLFDKIKNLSKEIIYKEIFGMIYGKYDLENPKEMLTKDEYLSARINSFSKIECETIYQIAVDYRAFLEKNGYSDNNFMSRALLGAINPVLYSVGIVDEAQDFTQVNLFLIKKLSQKLFCVGDALQMINPSYFGFGYLKRLMYGDVTGVNELKHNYRSSEKIEKIAQKLSDLNVKRFGTHSFVLQGESVKSEVPTATVFVKEKNFAELLTDKKYENVTVVVASQRKKDELRKKLKKVEILTVAEAKGLERSTVVLCDVLSDNIDKWNYLQNMTLNRKTADENSVFRYYFNLFYVGISRAKQYLLVSEGEYPSSFSSLFSECFDRKDKISALEFLSDASGKIELDDEELIERIRKFCELEQYANARFTADRLSTDKLVFEEKVRILAHEKYLRNGDQRGAGIEYWKKGMYVDARDTFIKSGDTMLLPLMDACISGGGALDVEIVKFFPLLGENEDAKRLILETLKNDYNEIMGTQKSLNEHLKSQRRKQ